MIKVFIVSLNDSPRRTSISQLCEKYGVEFEFVDAVNGRKLDDKYINKINSYEWTKLKYKRKLGPAEIGCTLSHLSIYKKNINSWFIVLEDDVDFDERFVKLINTDITGLRTDALYLLGGQEGLESFKNVIFSRFGGIKVNTDIVFLKTICSERFLFRTCCYMIHHSLAKRIVDFNQNKLTLADDWFNLSKFNIINNIYYIDLVAHPSDLSTSLIHSDRLKLIKTRQKYIEHS